MLRISVNIDVIPIIILLDLTCRYIVLLLPAYSFTANTYTPSQSGVVLPQNLVEATM